MAQRSRLSEGGKEGLRLRRPVLEEAEEVPVRLGFLRARDAAPRSLATAVARILREVRRRGDGALVEAVRAYDWPCPGPQGLVVSPQEVEEAWRAFPPSRKAALRKACAGIAAFHEGQRPPRCRTLRKGGLAAGMETFPLEAVGLYVPGGRAAYPSTLLMLGVPARLAGVGRIVVATPAGSDGKVNPAVLAAARLLGIQEIWKVGGAAAVAALAFGTETLKPVDKIFGPGNAYVTEAKRQVFGEVGVEALAGPTELVVISDGSAPPSFVAADLLAQAEHDPMACAVLLTCSEAERRAVEGELRRLLARSPRRAVQEESLRRRGALVLCRDLAVAAAAARFLAPEHLAVFTRNPRRWAREVPTAAAVFLGPYSPEAAGDYGAGPNHSLPTSGTARFSSPVTVWDFVRHRSFLHLDRRALKERGRWMETLARLEGLPGHGLSLEARRSSP